MRYLAISDSGEDLTTYLLLCDKPALCNDELVNHCAARSGSPHNDESSHYEMNQCFAVKILMVHVKIFCCWMVPQ